MSRVYLIAADKPLPLCDKQAERTSTTLVNGKTTISFVRGFRVSEHRYYRHAVDALGYSIKPWQYELEVELHPDDLTHLKQYLAENFSAGETVELWSIWVESIPPIACPVTAARWQTLIRKLWNSCSNPMPTAIPVSAV